MLRTAILTITNFIFTIVHQESSDEYNTGSTRHIDVLHIYLYYYYSPGIDAVPNTTFNTITKLAMCHKRVGVGIYGT